MPHTIDEVADLLTTAVRILAELPDDDAIDRVSTPDTVIGICYEIEYVVSGIRSRMEKRNRDTDRRPASTTTMTNFIVREIEGANLVRNKPTVNSIPGGVRVALLREAQGKCRLCNSEVGLTLHHILPRSEGGLSVQDNLIVLCKSCHDDVEIAGYRLRDEIMRHTPTGRTLVRQPSNDERAIDDEHALRLQQRAQERTRERIAQEQEVAIWAEQWSGLADTVQLGRIGDPPIERPEKRWHVIVYGAGRTSSLLAASKR